jgi:CRP-like cAMP-binding protein
MPYVNAVDAAKTDAPSSATLSPFERRGQRIRMAAKRVLFHKGDPASRLYLLVSGRVKISTISKSGQEMMLAILGPGDVIGEVAVLDRIERTATATTLEPCELLSISHYDVLAALGQSPESTLQLIAALTKRLRSATSLIEDLVFLDLPTRLAKTLMTLARTFGHSTGRGLRIECPVTQQELANMVGTTRESINKVLSAWKSKGWLSIVNGCLTIERPDDLMAATS